MVTEAAQKLDDEVIEVQIKVNVEKDKGICNEVLNEHFQKNEDLFVTGEVFWFVLAAR